MLFDTYSVLGIVLGTDGANKIGFSPFSYSVRTWGRMFQADEKWVTKDTL